MSHRFYLPAAAWPSPPSFECPLSVEESHHLTHVLRLPIGASLSLFDGEGHEVTAYFLKLEQKQAWVKLQPLEDRQIPTISSQPSSQPQLLLAQAIPKGKTMDLVIQKGVELGVSQIIPLITERTIVRFATEKEKKKKQERWQQIALEACKQCGQNYLPHIEQPLSFSEFLAQYQDSATTDQLHMASEALQLIASLEKGARPLPSWMSKYHDLYGHLPKRALLLIGPEGDFSPAEYRLATQAAFLPLSLGNIILRTETAALYGLSILRYGLSYYN